ncbi:hypothetical protein CHCC20375_2244 [Bacillus licheniformis]|nr:hypothetical protein CHCC20375_2244 [Bacillus licheniformis]
MKWSIMEKEVKYKIHIAAHMIKRSICFLKKQRIKNRKKLMARKR